MMRYSVQSRERIFVKDYGFMYFAKNIGTNIGKNISKNLSGKYSQKFLDHTNQSAADALKTSSKTVIQKTAEATGDLIGNKIANKIITLSKYSQQNNSETVTNENNKEIPKERYISLEKRQKIIDNLRLTKIIQRQLQMRMIKKYLKEYLKKEICLWKTENYWLSEINIIV